MGEHVMIIRVENEKGVRVEDLELRVLKVLANEFRGVRLEPFELSKVPFRVRLLEGLDRAGRTVWRE